MFNCCKLDFVDNNYCLDLDEVSSGNSRSPHLLSPSDEISRTALSRTAHRQSYILYEGKEGGAGEGYVHVKSE